MDNSEILARIGLALAIGFLIGVERGWRERDAAEGGRAAGLRTFALIGLSGGIWGLLAKSLDPIVLAAAFLAFAGAITLFKWRESEKEGNLGATTLVAALLTFGLGAYAVLGEMSVAAAAAVATAVLLASKSWLHGWLRHLSWDELRAALILLAMSFVALPILPDRGFGPYGAVNPHDLWLMTIAIAGVSFIGYVAVRVSGAERGALIGGTAGGLVSSTVTTLDFARKAKRAPAEMRFYLAGALAASATMFFRVVAIVLVFRAGLFALLGPPLIAAGLVSAGIALFLDMPAKNPTPHPSEADYRYPIELVPVLRFAALLATIMVVSRALSAAYGGQGAIALAAAAGLADVDAITLSLTELADSVMSPANAAAAILTAVVANCLSKTVLAFFAGGRRFGVRYLAGSAAAVAAGGLAAYFIAWPAGG